MEKEFDNVNRPKHYADQKYETIVVLEDWFSDEPLLWQTGKYISRWSKKGNAIENLSKARFYLQLKILQLKFPDADFEMLKENMIENLDSLDSSISQSILKEKSDV